MPNVLRTGWEFDVSKSNVPCDGMVTPGSTKEGAYCLTFSLTGMTGTGIRLRAGAPEQFGPRHGIGMCAGTPPSFPIAGIVWPVAAEGELWMVT
jgi:hypothetical protein